MTTNSGSTVLSCRYALLTLSDVKGYVIEEEKYYQLSENLHKEEKRNQ